MNKFMKKYWVNLRGRENGFIVEADLEDLMKTGLIYATRINKEGEQTEIIFNSADVETINEATKLQEDIQQDEE